MRDVPRIPMQSSLVRPDKMRLAVTFSYQSIYDHSLCRVDLSAGRTGEQLGLWVGPAPTWREPNEIQQWSRELITNAFHSLNLEYFGGEPF